MLTEPGGSIDSTFTALSFMSETTGAGVVQPISPRTMRRDKPRMSFLLQTFDELYDALRYRPPSGLPTDDCLAGYAKMLGGIRERELAGFAPATELRGSHAFQISDFSPIT